MADSTHKSQRTEKPTPKRLKKAREKGNVPRSSEVSGAMGLVGFLVFAHMFGRGWIDRLEALTSTLIQSSGRAELSPEELASVLTATVGSTGILLAAPLGLVVAASLAGNLVQSPPTFTLKPLEPSFDKLNPIKGIKKVFSLRQWVELIKGVLKMTLYAFAAYTAARDVILLGSVGAPGAEGAFLMLSSLAGAVLLRGAMLAAGLAVLDVLFRRYDHTRNLMMSKREIKEEFKETEGDPLIRGRIRQKQMAAARARMMADVAKATVVVTNPEHYAVALRYVAGETAAPKLLAKGRGLIAARIRELAAEYRVPIIADPPLARALYRSVPLGAEIPPALFRAVAEVLSLVLKRPKSRRDTVLADEDPS